MLRRAGHTEAGCDLARLAGLTPAAAICEVMNVDGTMARRADLERFAAEHGLKIGTIQDFVSAQAAANTRVELTSAISTVENAVLAPTAPLTVDQLIPGALCQLELHQTELPVSGQFRLQRVDAVANVASGSINEQITLTFQPIGTT